jgi:uncharacterized membrane protein
MDIWLAAFIIGIVAGLRAMTAPAAVAWGAAMGAPALGNTPLAFLGYAYTPWILTLLAVGELITDQLPSTPSRKVPLQFGTRLLVGALCGAALALHGQTGWGGAAWGGAVAGLVGALAGTLGGAAARGWLAARFGRDRPAALIEDAVAIIVAFLVVWSVR